MKKVILGVVISLLLFSCNKNYDYNESVALTYAHYRQQMNIFKQTVTNNIGTSYKVEVLERFEIVVDSCTNITKAIIPVPGAEAYHQTLIDLYAISKEELIPAYKEKYKLEVMDRTDDIRNQYYKASNRVDTVYNKILHLEDVSIAEQKKFAKAVNMKLASEM